MKRIFLTIALLLAATCSHAYILAGILGNGGGTATTYAPNAPTSATATPASTQNTITWTASATDGTHSAATSYNLLWGTVSGTLGNTITGVTSPYVHTGLTNGTAYYYKVRGVNGAGTADTAQFSGTPVTLAPNAPTAVAAAPGDSQATITWTASAADSGHSAATSYNLLRSTTSGAETLVQSSITSPYINTGLTNGTPYYFKVQAANSAGTANSSGVSATPTGGAFFADGFTGTDGAAPSASWRVVKWTDSAGVHNAADTDAIFSNQNRMVMQSNSTSNTVGWETQLIQGLDMTAVSTSLAVSITGQFKNLPANTSAYVLLTPAPVTSTPNTQTGSWVGTNTGNQVRAYIAAPATGIYVQKKIDSTVTTNGPTALTSVAGMKTLTITLTKNGSNWDATVNLDGTSYTAFTGVSLANTLYLVLAGQTSSTSAQSVYFDDVSITKN